MVMNLMWPNAVHEMWDGGGWGDSSDLIKREAAKKSEFDEAVKKLARDRKAERKKELVAEMAARMEAVEEDERERKQKSMSACEGFGSW